MEAVYFCIMEGVDAETKNKEDQNKNAFYYACSKNNIDMLQMLVECFQVKYDIELKLKFVPKIFTGVYNEGMSFEFTPLQEACNNNCYEIIEFLLKKYPHILDLKSNVTKEIFEDVCVKLNTKIIKMFLNSNPDIIFLRNEYNCIIINHFFAKCNLDDAK